VRSVSVQRLGSVLGRIPPSIMDAVDDALRLHLDL
jgi:mRNA interferase MazF